MVVGVMDYIGDVVDVGRVVRSVDSPLIERDWLPVSGGECQDGRNPPVLVVVVEVDSDVRDVSVSRIGIELGAPRFGCTRVDVPDILECVARNGRERLLGG